MDLKKIAIKFKEQPYDSRDYKASMFLTNTGDLPENYRNPHRIPIYPQVETSMCAGFALSSMMALMNYKERGKYERYSPGFLYGIRESNDWQGEGLYPREVMKMAQQYGVCSYNDFSNIGTFEDVKEALDFDKNYLMTKAIAQAIEHYYVINKNDIDNIKRAILKDGCVAIAWGLFGSVANVKSDGIVYEIQPGEKYYGGHLSYIVDWEMINGQLYWNVANSWGEDKADEGYYHLPVTYSAIQAIFGVTDRKPFSFNKKVFLRINDPKMYVQEGESYKIIEMDTNPIIDENNRTLIPIRAVAEEFDLFVEWEQETQTVIISNYKVVK